MTAIKITIKMGYYVIANNDVVQSGEPQTLPMAIKSILIHTNRIFSRHVSEIDF
jgi:hypothetical protein